MQKEDEVQVVDLQTSDNGRSHIAISLQDLKFNSFDQKHSLYAQYRRSIT